MRRLQPVKQTQAKQRELWRDFILAYCMHHRVFIVSVDAPGSEFPPFENSAIQRAATWLGRMWVVCMRVQTNILEP